MRKRAKGSLLISILAVLILVASGCARSSSQRAASPAEREAVLRQIAAEFAAGGSLERAMSALDRLGLANPAQLLIALAETDAGKGRPPQELEPLAELADALGASSPRLAAYLTPTAAPSPVPLPSASPTPMPTWTASSTPAPLATATVAPPATTSVPPAATAEATATAGPQAPRVVAKGDVNLRAGPGRSFAVIGRLPSGQEADIVGRNPSGDWWRLEWPAATQAWVAGTVVDVRGPIDMVAVAEDIPTPPPAPTQPPQPVQPTATPQPAGPDFRVESVRLWTVQENGGWFDGPSVHCGEKRELRVLVLDQAGNLLNGVTVKAVYGNQEEEVTGSKAPGTAEFVLGGGQDVYVVRDVDGRTVSSDYARGLSTDPAAIPEEQLKAAGYCADAGTCAHHREQGCRGHYSWEVIFRRAY